MDYYYFDANPLIDWAKTNASHSERRVMHIGKFVQNIIDDDSKCKLLSETTIVEFHTNLCKIRRSNHVQDACFDDAWMNNTMDAFMGLVGNKKITVSDAPPKLIEKAMVQVGMATTMHRRNLRAWDAVHITHAVHIARELNSKVSIITADSDIIKFLDIFPEFRSFVDICDPSDGFSI